MHKWLKAMFTLRNIKYKVLTRVYCFCHSINKVYRLFKVVKWTHQILLQNCEELTLRPNKKNKCVSVNGSENFT